MHRSPLIPHATQIHLRRVSCVVEVLQVGGKSTRTERTGNPTSETAHVREMYEANF